jgi:hypothetical protein
MSCHACGNSLPEQAVFCPECGVAVEGRGQRAEGRESGPSTLRPPLSAEMPSALRPPLTAETLLARANLLRMRGQWAEAVERCTEALQVDSHSAAAHSLLGDIYENQGRLDKAVHWYQLALEQNPDSIADRAKLARARELQAVRRRAGDSRLSWAYLVAVAGVAFLFVAFVMAAIAAGERRPVATTAVANTQLPEYPPSLAPRRQPADHTSEEEALVTFLREQLNSPYMWVSGVLLTPVEQEALITVQMTDRPVPPDELGGGRQGKLLREGYRIARLVQQQQRKQDLRFVTVRAVARLSSGSGPGPTVEVWRGRVNLTHLGASDDIASAREVASVYDKVFWSPISGL